MGVFRQFPYSNFHEMNMDEIIKVIKTCLKSGLSIMRSGMLGWQK